MIKIFRICEINNHKMGWLGNKLGGLGFKTDVIKKNQ